MNNQITTYGKKISELFLAICRAYYERYKNDAAAEVRENLDEIKALYGQMNDAQEQIKQIKGVEKCPNCGADAPKGTQFCSACGTRMEAVSQQAQFCVNCGAQLEAGSFFCTSCGAKVISDDTAFDVPSVAEDDPVSVEPLEDAETASADAAYEIEP